MRAAGCRVRLFPQPEHCSLKQLSFWLIQNRWHVHVGLLGCTYVRAVDVSLRQIGGERGAETDGKRWESSEKGGV